MTVSMRIYLIIGFTILGMATVTMLSARSIEGSLMDARREQTRRIVEIATTLTAEYKARAKSGEMTVEEAQKRALQRISNLRYDETNYFWVNDMDGKMLMHPTSPKLVGTDVTQIKDAKGVAFFADMIDIVKRNGGGIYEYYWKDSNDVAKPKVSYIKGDPDWKWVIGSGVFVDDVEKEVGAITQRLLMAVGGVLLVIVLMAVLIGRSISNPVRFITATMRKLAGGDLNVEIGMEGRHDEIGDMAGAVRVFQENARQVEKLKAEQIEAEKRAAEEKKKAMAKMADDFERSVGQVVNVVASAATELQTSAKSLSEISDQTSRQSATVAAATEEASASVQTVASAAEELSASIGEINRQVAESARVTSGAVEEVKRTNETVSTLSEAATQIGDVVKLIQDIAEQTNLLALNATIEAARAGEAGKGFAVVASEVKNLANQTAKATEEISSKIVTVQSVSGNAVSAIRGIGATIEKISEISGVITNAIQQQELATKEISNNVQQASAGTSEVSSNIVNVTHAATESRSAAGEVLQASGELSKQSEVLRAEINTFLAKVRTG